MVRRGGRARLQKQGGMLAALDNGDQIASQPMPMDGHLRPKENIHSNKPVSLKSASSPQKISKPKKVDVLSFKQQNVLMNSLKDPVQNKFTESPNRECSPLDICSPSAPFTSVKIKPQHDNADGKDEYKTIRRDLFQSPLSIASVFSGSSASSSIHASVDCNEHTTSVREEDSFASNDALSNRLNDCGSQLSNEHSEHDGEYSSTYESDDDDLDDDNSLDSQSSQRESEFEDSDLDSSEKRHDQSILREYQEDTDEEYSVHVESESSDELEFDADSSSSEDMKIHGKKKKEGQEKCKVNRPKNYEKKKRYKSKSARKTEKDDMSTESDSSHTNDYEGTDDESFRNLKRTTSQSEVEEVVSNVGNDSDAVGEGTSFHDSVTEENLCPGDPAHLMNNSATYISTLQHTRIPCSKSSRKFLLKAASTTEPSESEVLEIVDQLFKMIVDKDSVTVGDIVHSVAQHFGLSKVKKDMKKAIRERLTELIRADEESCELASTRNTEPSKEQSGKSQKRGAGGSMQNGSCNAGVGEKVDSNCVVDTDKCGKTCSSGSVQQSAAFESADSAKHPSDSDIISVVDQLFQAAESDTVFLSDIVRAVAARFGFEEVKKCTKQLIKARFIELINTTQITVEKDATQQFGDVEPVLADHSSIKSGFNNKIDVSLSYVKKGTPATAHEEPEAEVDSLVISFDEGESSFAVDCHGSNNDDDILQAVQTPIIEPKSPSSLMATIDSRGHSLAGEYLTCNESFTTVETTLFKNLSPECLKSNAADSVDNRMGSLSISNSLRGSSEFRRVEKGKWSLGNEIGSGSFGVVHVGMNAVDGSLMAIKVLRIPSTNKRAIVDELQREIDLMRSLKHPNIVRYLGAEVDTSNNILNIFQEWVPGGSVSSLLKKFGPFSFAVVKSYATQILKGLDYLHSHHIIHRDIKGGNILVSNDGCVKLADFGASKRVEAFGADPDKMMEELTARGTPYFMAPEVFEERYGPKADIWSVGGVIYQMATGSPPWKDLGHKNPISLFFHLKNTSDPPKLPPSTSSRSDEYSFSLFEEIISKCFQRDPTKRPNASTLLNDNFFSTNTVNSGPTVHIVDKLSYSSHAVTSSQTATVQSHASHEISLSDSLCYSLTLPAASHVDKSLKCEIDTSDWPDWAKKSYQHSERMKESNESMRNPFGRSVGRK